MLLFLESSKAGRVRWNDFSLSFEAFSDFEKKIFLSLKSELLFVLLV